MSDLNACICCASKNLVRLGKLRGFDSQQCEACGYVKYDLDGALPDANTFQSDDDYNSDLDQGKNYRALMQWHHYKALNYLTSVQQGSRSGLSLLDVGCFNGFFVKACVDAGISAAGIDFNETAVVRGTSEYGLTGRLHNASLADLSTAQHYDAVTLFEVIEHLDDPRETLSSVKRVMRPGAHLLLSCPNAHSVWRPPADYPPHHVSRFTSASLTMLLEQMGFDVVACDVQASSFLLLKHRLGAIARQGKKQGGSMRGGGFGGDGAASRIRSMANKFSKQLSTAFAPADAVMRLTGKAYLGLFVIAKLR